MFHLVELLHGDHFPADSNNSELVRPTLFLFYKLVIAHSGDSNIVVLCCLDWCFSSFVWQSWRYLVFQKFCVGVFYVVRGVTWFFLEYHRKNCVKSPFRTKRCAQKICDGLSPDLVSSHSLRAVGATALHLNGCDAKTIQILGRGNSETFLTYIHHQIAAFSLGLSACGILYSLPQHPPQPHPTFHQCTSARFTPRSWYRPRFLPIMSSFPDHSSGTLELQHGQDWLYTIKYLFYQHLVLEPGCSHRDRRRSHPRVCRERARRGVLSKQVQMRLADFKVTWIPAAVFQLRTF
jgi:hypothetical protein